MPAAWAWPRRAAQTTAKQVMTTMVSGSLMHLVVLRIFAGSFWKKTFFIARITEIRLVGARLCH